jgi:hypothetical protein
MAIINEQLSTIQNSTLNVPAGQSWAITNIFVCNTYDPNAGDADTRTASFDLHFVKNGENLANQRTCVIRELELPAGETFTFDTERIVLEEFDRVIFVAQPGGAIDPETGSPDQTLTDLAATISYLEV